MSLPTGAALAPAGRLFAIAASLEALTWVGLLAGMWLKHGAGATDLGVWLFGRLHGAAFLFYLAATLLAGMRLRWSMGALLLGLLASIPPLATIPLERWFRGKGLLAGPAAR